MKIKIKSDGNELELVEVIKDKKGSINIFKYTKSVTKLGQFLGLTDAELEKMKSNGQYEL
jgi:hypothetical protein